MSKQYLKGLISGFIITFLLTSVVFASTKTIDVLFNGVNIVGFISWKQTHEMFLLIYLNTSSYMVLQIMRLLYSLEYESFFDYVTRKLWL